MKKYERNITQNKLHEKIKTNLATAPPPRPMTAIPVANPGLSGNQRISVEMGEM